MMRRPSGFRWPRPTRPVLFWLPFVLALAAVGPVLAQSPMAVQNIGQRLETDDARMVGRGGWGMAVKDTMHPGFKNPASLSVLDHIALNFTGYGERVEHESVSGSRKTSKVFTPDIRVGIPVLMNRFSLTAGFTMNRTTLWNTNIDTTWTAFTDEVIGRNQFLREGTQFRVPLGASLELIPGVAVSGMINLEYGMIRETISDLFIRPSGIGGVPFYGANVKVQEDDLTGTSYTVAFLLAPGRHLRVGGSWTPAYTLDVERRVAMGGVSERENTSWNLGMPDEYRAGVELHFLNRWSIGADALFAEFTKMEGPADWVAEMEDETMLGFGLDRSQGYKRKGGMSNWPLRLGASIHRWAYRVDGSPVEERALHVGTGFPFRNQLGHVDISLSYGTAGKRQDNGMESTFLRFTLSVTGLEKWW